MNTPVELSAVVIALNEEPNIPGLLAALDWVDEVIVVDGGSHDATCELAQRSGARVFSRTFDNFAAQRNFGADQAQGRWILTIDADERPTPGFAAEVRRRIAETQAADSPAAAWRAPIRSHIFGRQFRFSGTQNDRPIRLYERSRARWCGEVHERLQVTGHVDALTAHLEHRTIPDLAAFLTKMQRYTTLAAASAVAQGSAPRGAWQPWTAAARETLRRLCFKHGWLDGPEGWAFCLLSGLSAWVESRKHRQLWGELSAATPNN